MEVLGQPQQDLKAGRAFQISAVLAPRKASISQSASAHDAKTVAIMVMEKMKEKDKKKEVEASGMESPLQDPFPGQPSIRALPFSPLLPVSASSSAEPRQGLRWPFSAPEEVHKW